MKITFGLSLDGFRPSVPVFNHMYCGPMGLVEALELRLGLAAESTGAATRLHRYLGALEKTSAAAPRFFSESLKVDRWGTAANLLSMRDELRMAGWDGVDSSLPRLQDLSAAEKIASFPPGLPDRMEAICVEIATKSPQISEIQCVEPAVYLPLRLRCLLEKLGATFSCVPDSELAGPATNLRLVQDYLCGRDISGKSWREGDDSVIFATAFSEITLAHAAAQILQREERPTLLATASAGPIADVLNISQAAAPALDSASPLRPAAQVLGLALEMRWEPPDPSRLLQFLSHPVCPVSRALRMHLSESIADRPGIGSVKWHESIDKCRERIRNDENLSPDEIAEKLSRIESDLKRWIFVERFPRSGGAPGSALAETARQVEIWARKRASITEDESQSRHFASLASTAAEFSGIITEIPIVSPEELSLILEQVSGSGTLVGDRIAELGAPRFLPDAGAAIEAIDSILWWGFEQKEPRLSKRWSLEELKHLEKIGVLLPMPENDLALARACAGRPFLAARTQIVLLWPRVRGSEPVERHPLYTTLEAKLGPLPSLDLDKEEFPLIKVERPVQPLPSKKRWVNISDPTLLSSRQEESYSSLSKFALRPFEWVFHYKAKLRRGSLKEINLLAQRGNLLHRVVERMLEPGCSMKWISATNSEFDRWLDSIWPQLLQTEGANFLMPGCQTDGQRLLGDARRAIWDLVGHMKRADAVSAEADVRMEPVPFESTMLGGIIDLNIINRHGKTAVVDLKFGQGKPKRKELETNTALQLAAYGKLVSETSGGAWPAVAYYILRSGSFLAQDQTFFPDAVAVMCSSASPGPEAMWSDFLEVWRWRRKQLDSGWVEIPTTGTDPTDGTTGCPSSLPPIDAWTSDPSAPRYDDFKFLTGWEITQ